MKRLNLTHIALLCALVMVVMWPICPVHAAAGDSNFTNVVASGDITAGGALNVTGATTLATVTATTATVTYLLNSASQPITIRRGTATINGTGSTTGLTTVTTGLSFIATAQLTMVKSSAPTTSVNTYAVSGGTLSIYSWKPTGVSTTTLTASDGTETVAYEVLGY